MPDPGAPPDDPRVRLLFRATRFALLTVVVLSAGLARLVRDPDPPPSEPDPFWGAPVPEPHRPPRTELAGCVIDAALTLVAALVVYLAALAYFRL